MAEWNLSVRLTGQGSGLARTLRDLSRDARTASRNVNALRRDIDRLRTETRNPIRVRLDVDGAHLRRDVTTALASAGSGQGLRVRLDLDTGHLRTDVSAALTAAGSGQGLAVNLRLGNAMQLRREVEAAVRWAAWGHRIEIPIGLRDPNRLRDDVTAAVRRAERDQTIRLRVTADTSALRGLGSTLGGGSSGGSGGRFGMIAGLLPIATAAIPLVAGLTASLGPLASAFTATGGAATAFGIALAGQIEPMSQVADAEKKYQEAVRDHGRSSAEAMEAQLAYQQVLAELPPETQKAAIALSSLKSTFSDWSDDMSNWTMEPVTKGFTVLEALVPHMSREVQSFSGQMDRLMDVAGGAISTPGFDAFSDRVAELTDAQLDDFTDQVVHLLRVVSEGDADSGVIGEMLSYLRENGPEAREALNAIGDAVGTLVEGAAQAGPTMLTLVAAVAQLVAALPPEVVAVILQTATALKLLQLAGAGMGAISAGVSAASASIAALAATSAAAGGGLAGLRAAFLSLGVAARASIIIAGIAAVVVVLKQLSDIGKQAPPDVDKLTTSLGELGQTGEVAGEAARAFGKDLGGLADSLRTLSRPSNLDKTQQFLTNLIGMDSTPVKEAKEDLDAVDESLANLVKSGKGEIAAAALERIGEAMRKQGMSQKELEGQLDGYQSALADQAFEAELAAQSMGLFGEAAQKTSAKLDAQKSSADGLRQSIVALNDVNRAAGSAMSAFEQSLDDATAAVKDHSNALKVRDGELDLGSQKARDAEKVLSDLAANTDAAATAAREQGRSWEYVSGIQERGRDAFIKAADAMGLSKQQAEALADSYLKIPDKKTTSVEMRTEDAIAGLDAVIAAIEETPNAKSVTVNALTADAVTMLENLGFTVTALPDGRFQVTAETETAKSSLEGLKSTRDGLQDKTITINSVISDAITDLEEVKAKVASTNGKTITMKAPTAEARQQLELLGFKIRDTKGKNVVITVPTGTQRSNVGALAGAIAGLRNKTVTITTRHVSIHETVRRNTQTTADLIEQQARNFQANGSILDFYADGGIQRGGVRAFADGSENHVAQIAPAGSWRVWGEPETMGEAYIPFAPSKRVRSRAIAEETVQRLGGDPASIQWNADGSVTDWRYDPVSGSLYSPSDAAAAGKKTRKVRGKEVSYYDIAAVERKLWDMGAATVAWNRNLEKVADRAGGDVADALASMGEDGLKIAAKMATGTNKYVASMSIALRRLNQEARASLKDFTVQLNHATGNNRIFQNNLFKLASMGYGSLASQLAGQGDEAAMDLAASAVSDTKRAAAANAAVKANAGLLSSDDITTAITVLSVLRGKKGAGIADVLAAGVDWPTLRALFPRIGSQIRALPAAYRDTIITQMAGQGVKAMARGGILTQPTMVLGGEAGVPESWIPHDGSKRSQHLLAETAKRMGYHLVPAHAVSVTAVPVQSQKATVQHNDNRRGPTITINGASRSFAEQQADLLRHMKAVG